MFPTTYRTKAVGATTDANWVGNIFIAMLPPVMLAHMGFKTFYAFTVVSCFGFLFGSLLSRPMAGRAAAARLAASSSAPLASARALTPPPSGPRPRSLGAPSLQQLTLAPQQQRATKLMADRAAEPPELAATQVRAARLQQHQGTGRVPRPPGPQGLQQPTLGSVFQEPRLHRRAACGTSGTS